MSAFGKDWVHKFKSESSREEVVVHEAYTERPIAMGSRRQKREIVSALPPILNIKTVEDLPQELTVREVAKVLRLRDPESVTCLIRKRKLYGVKQGREWRIPLWSLAKYLSEREAPYVA